MAFTDIFLELRSLFLDKELQESLQRLVALKIHKVQQVHDHSDHSSDGDDGDDDDDDDQSEAAQQHTLSALEYQQKPKPSSLQQDSNDDDDDDDDNQSEAAQQHTLSALGYQQKPKPSSLQQDSDYEVKPQLTTSEENDMQSCSGSSKEQDDKSKIMSDKRKKLIEKLKKIEPEFLIEKQNLKWEDRLGRGNFGVVTKGVLSELTSHNRVPKKNEVAIKELRKVADDKSHNDFISEALHMYKLRKINHPNIIKFIGVCIDETDDEDKVMIITELAALGNLKSYLVKNHATIEKSVYLDYCIQICHGMEKLEEEDILHRDLALRNILVRSEDLVKISDFGLARITEYYKAEESGKWPLKWYAPESIEYNKFTSKSDVWSFGVTMWEIFSNGEDPYPTIDLKEIFEHISKGNRLPKPNNCPDDIYLIMQQCWLENPEKRPSFYALSVMLNRIKNFQ